MKLNTDSLFMEIRKDLLDFIKFSFLLEIKSKKEISKENKSFNKSTQSFKNLTRSSLSHNLVSYYEGYTID